MTSDEGLPDGWVAAAEGNYAKVGRRPRYTTMAAVSRDNGGWWRLYRVSSSIHDETLWIVVDRKFASPVEAMVYHELNSENEP